MNLDTISALVAQVLALSLATERIVTMIKTLIPGLFAEPHDAPLGAEKEPLSDRWRRFRVQLVSLAVAFGAAHLVNPSGTISIGGTPEIKIPIFIFALLATGGSAFWANILNITSTVKDLRLQERTANATVLRNPAVLQAAPVVPPVAPIARNP